MRIHCLEHAWFEGPVRIATWAKERGHSLTTTRLYQAEKFPSFDQFDCLVILGGPMGAYEDDKYDWMLGEKKFIEGAIGQSKMVLGICLGSQLIANILGARVYKHQHKEIGWFPITLTPAAKPGSLLADWPESPRVFHWHGDTFDLPNGAVHLAESAACKNQAFQYGERVLGLQFHPEMDRESIATISEEAAEDLLPKNPGKPETYVQSHGDLLAQTQYFDESGRLLTLLLSRIEETTNAR